MNSEELFHTRTMARIHAEQGNMEKAQEIYAYLMEKEPGAGDLAEALATLNRKRRRKQISELEPLVKSWARLSIQHARLKRGVLPISI